MNAKVLDQQRMFAEAYVLGSGNATQAAIAAGYSVISARQTASRLLGAPHVQDAIRHAQARTLRGRLASKALGVLEKILDDDDAPAGVRVDAAKTVLDRAGLSAIRTPEVADDDDGPLEGMTLPELEAFIVAGRRELDSMRRAIPGETVAIATAKSARSDRARSDQVADARTLHARAVPQLPGE